jgi:hypothetical protein
MKVSGRCYCGQISFEAEIEPDKVRVCHRTDCQTRIPHQCAGRTGTLVLKKGEPKTFSSEVLEGGAVGSATS